MEFKIKGPGYNSGRVAIFPYAVRMPKHIEDIFRKNDQIALIPDRSLADKYGKDHLLKYRMKMSDEKMIISREMDISYMNVAFDEENKAQLLKVYSEPNTNQLYGVMRGDHLPFLYKGSYVSGEVRYIMPYSMATVLTHIRRFETEIFDPRYIRAFGILSDPGQMRLRFYFIIHPECLEDQIIKYNSNIVDLDLVSGRVTHSVEYDHNIFSCINYDPSDTDASFIKKGFENRTACFSMIDAYRMVRLLISESGILNFSLPDRFGFINKVAEFLKTRNGEAGKLIFSSSVDIRDAVDTMLMFSGLWKNFYSFVYNCIDVMPSYKFN